jgi:hypothetical protein
MFNCFLPSVIISIYYFFLFSIHPITNFILLVGFEVLTVVVMKSTIFWDIKLCSLLKVNRRFGGTYRLHLQGRRISSVVLSTSFDAGFLLGLFFDPEDGGDMFLRNVG